MAAQKPATVPQSAIQRGDNRLFRAAGVGDERSFRTMQSRLANVFHDFADGRTDNDQFRLGHALVQVDCCMCNGPDAPCDSQAGLPPPDADDIFRKIFLAQRQSDRSTDQSDPDDGNGIPLFHGILEVFPG
jgi:hypothetical protein